MYGSFKPRNIILLCQSFSRKSLGFLLMWEAWPAASGETYWKSFSMNKNIIVCPERLSIALRATYWFLLCLMLIY